MMKKSILLSLLLLAGICLSAQTKAELEKQRDSIQKEINAVKKSLDQTTKNKKQTLGQLALIQKKLRLREAQINNINKQMNLIQGDIYQSSRDIYKLRKELDTLKLQYEKSVVYAYMNRSNYDFLNFLFSSTSFNDALKRIAYLRSYRSYREQQAENIHNTQDLLKQKIAGLNENKKKKGEVLVEENKQRGVLEEEKQEKNDVVSKLKSREKELNKELTAKKKQDKALTNAISAAVRRAKEDAIREAKAAAAKKDATTKATVKTNVPATGTSPVKEGTITKKDISFNPLDADPAARKLSEDFEKNKGILPWPVASGNISIPFGRYFVEGLKGVEGDSPSITIETKSGVSVKAIFNGEVVSVFFVGSVQAVIIRHGRYFTSYSNLESISVSKGQKVQVGQVVGRAGDKGDGTAEVELVISDATHNLDPEKWLRR